MKNEHIKKNLEEIKEKIENPAFQIHWN